MGLGRTGNPCPCGLGTAVSLPVPKAWPTCSNTVSGGVEISYLGKQVLKKTLRTLMYFSTGLTGRMRNRSGSSILGFGVAGSSSHLISWNTIPRGRAPLVEPSGASFHSPPRTRLFTGDKGGTQVNVRKGQSGDLQAAQLRPRHLADCPFTAPPMMWEHVIAYGLKLKTCQQGSGPASKLAGQPPTPQLLIFKAILNFSKSWFNYTWRLLIQIPLCISY